MSDTAVIRDVTEATFDRDVVEASRTQPVVVDFWAPWCGPCHQLAPIVEDVAARHAGDVAVAKLDIDQAPGVARRYGIQGIPAVKAFKDGRVVDEFVGVQPPQVVERFFAGLAPSAADRLVARAAEVGDGERETVLREALAAQPDHPGAVVGLAELLLGRGETDEARALLERVPADEAVTRLRARLALGAAADGDVDALRARADAGDAEARLELGRALAARGEHDEALGLLVTAVREPATREAARSAVLDVFAVLGGDHPLVTAWRPRLASALF